MTSRLLSIPKYMLALNMNTIYQCVLTWFPGDNPTVAFQTYKLKIKLTALPPQLASTRFSLGTGSVGILIKYL